MAHSDPTPPVHRELSELSLLYEISIILDQSPDLREVVGPVLQALSDHMGILHGTITLLNRETRKIQIEAAHGLTENQRKRGEYGFGEGVTGKVVATGNAMVVPRISQEPLFQNRTGARSTVEGQDISFVCVPIKLGNEVVGALSADRLFSEDNPLAEDKRLLTIIASMMAQAIRLRQTMAEERDRLLRENERLQSELRERFHPSNIIGNSKGMHEVYDSIEKVAKSNTTVLIRGESGVGKELIAHAIHHHSLRAGKPYIKVNCAALPESVIETELFGHEKGAFTGALTERKGRFELADGGTLFLDEIGDISSVTQVKLLRVLQEREFERVGSSKTTKVDVRIITATNRNLEDLVQAGTFREELYYRLNVFPIHIPPLRERRSDILLLSDYFAAKYARANNTTIKRISTNAIDMLTMYHWPGNVRELENVIERAALLSSDGVIHGYHLPPTLQTAAQSGTVIIGGLDESIGHLERELIIDALKNTRGNCAEAARHLKISERIMGLRIKKHQIDPKRFRTKM